MAQKEIDERIHDLKQRVEIIEQLVGVNSMLPAEQNKLGNKAILDALQHIKEMKEQALSKNKSMEVYLKEHRTLC